MLWEAPHLLTLLWQPESVFTSRTDSGSKPVILETIHSEFRLAKRVAEDTGQHTHTNRDTQTHTDPRSIILNNTHMGHFHNTERTSRRREMERANGERGSEHTAGSTRSPPQGDVRAFRHTHAGSDAHLDPFLHTLWINMTENLQTCTNNGMADNLQGRHVTFSSAWKGPLHR